MKNEEKNVVVKIFLFVFREINPLVLLADVV